MKKEIKFTRKNLISCINVPIQKVIWEYICWVLAGKPDGHAVNTKIIKKK